MDNLYTYKAKVVRVVDGDTYDLIVDLGFKINISTRIRLRNIDTPETWRPKNEAERIHGEKATKFVTDLILDKEVYIKSYKLGIYGRYEVDIYIPWLQKDLATLLKENGFEKLKSYKPPLEESWWL